MILDVSGNTFGGRQGMVLFCPWDSPPGKQRKPSKKKGVRKWRGGQRRAKRGSYNQRSECEPQGPGFLESPPTQAGQHGSLGAHWADPASPGSRGPGTSDSGLASAEKDG